MKDTSSRCINKHATIKQALEQMNLLTESITLFVLDNDMKLVGTVTDGDIRRGLLSLYTLDESIERFMNRSYRYLRRNDYGLDDIKELRDKDIRLVPIVDDEHRILRLVNFGRKLSILPIDAVIMAGGRGERLSPLTDSQPKPLLMVGEKPILEHNIDALALYGVNAITITVNYRAQQIIDYFGSGHEKGIEINYIREDIPLGTIGSLRLIEDFHHDYVLVMNSDLLTNINYEDLFREFVAKGADIIVATVPYQVIVPYAVMETDHENILSFKEKPTYTYYSNAGIYLIKRELVSMIPENTFYDATDLMEQLISENKKVVHYPLLGYWLDIGRHEDFKKAQEDIKHIKL